MAAYTNAAYYKTYFFARGVDVSAQTDSAIDAALLVSTEYLDDTWDFTGYLTVTTQAQKWPRSSVYNSDGVLLDSSVVPSKVKDSCCELAYIHQTQTGGLQPLFDGQVIRKETKEMSPFKKSIEYDTNASATYERYYAKAVKKIQDFIVSAGSNAAYIQRVI